MNNKIFYKYNVEYILSILMLFAVVILLTTDIASASKFTDFLSAFGGKMNSMKTTVGTMFANFDATGRVGIALVKFVAILCGFILFFVAGLKAVRFSDGKEQFGPVLYTLITGVLLISIIPVIDMTSNTLGFNNTSAGLNMICNDTLDGCGDQINSIEQHTKAALVGLITFIRLVGYIAVFRGIVALHEKGKAGGSPKSFAQPLFFTIGGVLCINCVYFAMMLGNTLAPNSGFTDFFRDSEIGSAIKP